MSSANIEKAKELTQKLKRLFPEYEKLQSKTESGKLLNDGEKERSIQKVEVKSILAVSDEAPGTGEVLIQNSGF